MPRRAPLLIACVFSLLSLPLSACERNKADTNTPEAEDPVDRLTRDLLGALEAPDRARLVALANPTLAAEFEARELASVSQTLTWLGPISGLSHANETPVANGIERHYQVSFDRGELGLAITIVAGKVEGFEFDAVQWDALSDRAAEAHAGSLRVTAFSFLGDTLDPKAIDYRMTIEGLGAELREHHVTVGKVVLDSSGAEVYRQRKDDSMRFPQAGSGGAGGHLDGGVTVPGAGTYTLELLITDQIAGESITHRVPLTIP